MTQNTQTTRERIAVLIHWEGIVEAPKTIAAEIDRLTAERDEALAEVERLRLPAEAWEAWREYDELIARMPLTRDTEQEQAVQDAATKRSAAYARARAAKVTP